MATASSFFACDPCKKSEEEQVPVAFCLECRELYCHACLNCHRKMKLTESHLYVYFSGDESGENCPCDLCNVENGMATSFCVECRELYCTACTNRHRNFKASKGHVVVEIVSVKSDFNVKYVSAQVSIDKTERQNQQDGKSVNEKKMSASASGDSKTTLVSKPLDLHSGNSVRRSDLKQTSLSGTVQCKFSIRTPSDKKPNEINRMISMPDGRICVVDRGDYKMKLYTDNYVFCDEVSVRDCAVITCVDDDTVAIATHTGAIRRYSVKRNKITQTGKTLDIKVKIYDIAYRRGEFIMRYNKDNTDYTCYGSKLIVKQDRLLFFSDFMHYDPVNDCVILGNSSSAKDYTVNCYTLDGNVIWRVTLDGPPRGIVMVNSIIQVAVYNNTIRQITMDGRLLSTPLLTKDHDIVRPNAITYQHNQHRLLVTSVFDDNVIVFNLSQ